MLAVHDQSKKTDFDYYEDSETEDDILSGNNRYRDPENVQSDFQCAPLEQQIAIR